MKTSLKTLALLLVGISLVSLAPLPRAQAADPVVYKIWPMVGRDRVAENPTPPWTKGPNLLWIAEAQSLDLTTWEIKNALISTAVRVPNADPKKAGLHVNLYPMAVGEVEVIQKDSNGRRLSNFRMFFNPNPLPAANAPVRK